MRFRQVAVLALALLALGACKRNQPETGPEPVAEDTAAINARERARADSIAAARAAEAEAEAEARRRAAELARARESLTQPLYFDYDSEALTSEAEARLRAKASILRANPAVEIRIAGHADERGSTEYNLALGQRRAETVRNYLTRYGIDAGRLTTISYGEERPDVEGTGESVWSQNRRAEFDITAGEVSTVPPDLR